MRRPSPNALLSLLMLLLAPAAGASEPFAYGVGVAPSGVFELRLWDLADGTFSVVTPLDLTGPVAHLTFGPDGTLYGLDMFEGRLITIDPSSGETTVIGPLNEPPEPIQLHGFAADACGRLWASGYVVNQGPGPVVEPWLFGIDPQTGNLKQVASGDVFHSLALVGEGERLWGLGFDGLVRVDLTDFSVHEVGGEPPAIPRGLGFGADGTLWATAQIPPPPITVPPNFGQYAFTVDPATGEVAGVAEHVPIPLGELTIAPPGGSCLGGSPLAVPALEPAGLAALALLLALGAVLRIRRYGAAAR